MRILDEICAEEICIYTSISYHVFPSVSSCPSYSFSLTLLLSLKSPIYLSWQILIEFMLISSPSMSHILNCSGRTIWTVMRLLYVFFLFIILFTVVSFLWLRILKIFYLLLHFILLVRGRILEFMLSTGVRLPPPINDYTLLASHQMNNLSPSISGQGSGPMSRSGSVLGHGHGLGLGSASRTSTSDHRWD